MTNRNKLRCHKCGAEVKTHSADRACYKCETRMERVEDGKRINK